MSKIRKLLFFDKKKTLEMISFLNNDAGSAYINGIMFNPLILLHHLLPLRFKYLPESYVLREKSEIKGLITLAPNKSRQKKVEIKKLFFEENSYEEAAELVQYAVSKYKAMGASSVLVKVDDYLPELISMFVSKCGFSQISYERLWRITKFPEPIYDKREFRHFRNSDAQVLANIYNDSLLPHFRPLLSIEATEFREDIFKGLSYISEYKYTIIDKKTRNITGCIIIQTSDNENYIVDIIQNSWANLDINEILSYAIAKIKRRNKKFGLFVRTKKYTNIGEVNDKIYMDNGFECVQTQNVLTNSSAKVLKVEEKTGKYTAIGDFCPNSVMPT
jgi:hypothetical protein